MKSRLLFFVALFALVAVVAFGAGSSHLVHGSSPVFASDPVFSGTGVQLPSDSANPAHLTGNIYFNTATGYLTFDDGTTYHSIPGLDMANTWAGVQTFNVNPVLASGVGITWGGTTGNIGSATAYPATIFANALTAEGTTPTITGFSLAGTYNIGGAPTLTATLALNGQTLSGASTFTGVPNFNAGIIFNAAGSIASTNTFIEADGAGGNMLANVPTGKLFEIGVNGVYGVTIGAATINFGGSIGSNVITQTGVNGGIQFNTQGIQFGLGGGNSFVLYSSQIQASGFFNKYDNINTVGLGLPPIYASGLLVSIGTTSTTIATYTPTSSTGQQFVIQWTLSAASATTPTCTATFTDPKAGAQTVTLFSSAMASGTVQQGSYSLVATSGSAVTMSCSALVGSAIFGTASISQYQ